ncbi:MAG TPA: hypothetical protein VFU13_05845 [Steroidobacteraceae bacterium]|nr:hypothetical protein [Steroidobacteraceae bacterium]
MQFRTFRFVAAVAVLGAVSATASAATNYVQGHINNVTFAGDEVLIQVDVGLPDNCIGTHYGWMRIPPEYKSMNAFVIGLWMRGDASQTLVVVYTEGLAGSYCRIGQIDPAG